MLPPSADAKQAKSEKIYDTTPVTQTMDNGPEQKPVQQRRFTYRWRLTFPTPENKDITPRKKFAMLLLMMGQFWPSTLLNMWSVTDSLQGLSNGKDLPYLRNNLVVYCPHVKQRNCLETILHLSLGVKLETMKENRAFMQHLQTHRIFINVTALTMAERDIWVWCTILHPNQTCRDKATDELNRPLAMEGQIKLCQYITRGGQNQKKAKVPTTRSLVIAGGADEKDEGIEQLLAFNSRSQEEKDFHPYMGH
eukprot:8394293-Ditylum_brightwellii.AAC.1